MATVLTMKIDNLYNFKRVYHEESFLHVNLFLR